MPYVIVFLLLAAFWMWMIVDCALFERGTATRIVWLIVLVPCGPVASLIYYLVRALPRVIAEAGDEAEAARGPRAA
jgi:hypothetical protein